MSGQNNIDNAIRNGFPKSKTPQQLDGYRDVSTLGYKGTFIRVGLNPKTLMWDVSIAGEDDLRTHYASRREAITLAQMAISRRLRNMKFNPNKAGSPQRSEKRFNH